jgi:signal transduction histidine kinase/ActR/RegA family two-component response regulator
MNTMSGFWKGILESSRVRARDPTGIGLRAPLILLVVAVCGAVWLSALLDTVHHRAIVLELAHRQHDHVARALAEQSARALQAIDLILKQAELLDPGGVPSAGDVRRIPDLLRIQVSGVPQVQGLFLFDPARHLYLASGPGPAYLDLSDRSYFVVQATRKIAGTFVSEPLISRTLGNATFVLSRRLPGDRFHGIVAASVRADYFRNFYRGLELGAGSTVDLLRSDGVSLVSRDGESLSTAPGALAAAVRELGKAGPVDAANVTIDDPRVGRSHVSLCRVPGYPAVVAVARSESTLLQGWIQDAWTNAARTFAITALAAILLVAFLRQLRRRDRLAAHLHQSQKLEALGTLAGGIAHDFNNILGAILGYGELAQHDAGTGTTQRRYVDNIVLAANRARDLVARILAFSRPGINTPRPLLLQQVVRETIELMRLSLAPEVKLDTQWPAEPVVVMGDGAQINQVVGNLLSNAVQAVDGHGRVRVSVDVVSIESARDLAVGRLRPGRYGLLQVGDTGPGIAPDVFGRIFDPFFTTKPGVGTGLGLSQVHASVLDHDGAIAVDSGPGRGTQFGIYLPLTDQLPPLESDQVAAPQGHGEVILVVDDEAVLVRLAEEVLASIGYEPIGCVGAQEALEVFRAEPERFDALLTDVLMSGMTGPELAVEVRKMNRALPVILMSGFCGPNLKARVAPAEARAILLKPLKAAQLAQCLAAVFARQSGLAHADAMHA